MGHQMDPSTQREIRAIRGNDMCVDCLAPNPQWASISFGSLFCLDCSGQHRGLGVHISFVRSITMDSWTEPQLQHMRQGGNAKLREWFSERGVPNNMRISAKYHTPDAEYYSKRLKAIVEGKEMPAMPPRQAVDTSIDYSKGDPNGKEKLLGESDDDYIARQKRLNEAARQRMQAKFGGGGRMGGVGSDPNYDPNAAAATGVDVGALVSGIGSLWGTVTAKTRDLAEDLKSRELGQKLKGGLQNTVEATKSAWQNNVDQETRTKVRETATGLWSTVTSVVSGEDDEWDDWGDEKKKRFPRSASNNSNSGGGGESGGYGGSSGVEECQGAPGEDRNGPGRLTGESEVQYIARQTRIREEAKERMRQKFGGGGGGLGGVGASSGSDSYSSSSSSAYASQPPAPPLSMSSKYADNASSFNDIKPPSPLASSTSTPSLSKLSSPTPSSSMNRSSSSQSVPKSPPTDVDFFSDFGM